MKPGVILFFLVCIISGNVNTQYKAYSKFKDKTKDNLNLKFDQLTKELLFYKVELAKCESSVRRYCNNGGC